LRIVSRGFGEPVKATNLLLAGKNRTVVLFENYRGSLRKLAQKTSGWAETVSLR
jgi:hypothetical protein